MADSTNLSVFGQETYFNEKAHFFSNVDVGGNLRIINGNLILESENGIKYKLVVSDLGILSASPV